MDLSTLLGLLLAAISALFTYKSYCIRKSAENDKDKIKEMKKEIEDELKAQRDITLQKQDLLVLVPKIKEIKEIKEAKARYRNIINNSIGKSEISKKEVQDEINEYVFINNQVSAILDEIPEVYKEVRELLINLKKTFTHCVDNKKTFNQLDRNSEYGYYTVESDFGNVLSKMKTITREIN